MSTYGRGDSSLANINIFCLSFEGKIIYKAVDLKNCGFLTVIARIFMIWKSQSQPF
jgi:hypothetical protein